MCKMHLKDITAVFYVCEMIVIVNIAKIKHSRIKDIVQYTKQAVINDTFLEC